MTKPNSAHRGSPATWDHSVTCHLTEINVPQLDSIREGWKAELSMVLAIYQDSLAVCRQSPIQVVLISFCLQVKSLRGAHRWRNGQA